MEPAIAMQTRRARHVFWWGLAASILLHLGLLSRAWILPPVWGPAQDSAPIEARLALPPPPVKPVVSQPVPVPRPAKPPPRRPPPSVVAPPPPREPPATPADSLPPDIAPVEAVPVAPAAETPAAPPVAAPPPLNPLPRRITLEYRARYGLASGQQTLLWVNEGDRYTITSIASARGLASLVFSGKLVQTSRGRIIATGLQPEEFWDQRGDKRSQSRFDYATQTILTDSSKGPQTAALPAGLQDVQSLLFQIALTAPPIADSENIVFNGKKVRSYRYRVLGEESLDTPLGRLRTLHMVRLAESSAERFEIWLAVDRYYLPVKLSTEISGYDAEILVQSIASEN